MAGKAIETLNTDQRAELPILAREQPQETERMADGNGVGWPVLFTLRTAGDEAEIDQGDFDPFKMVHDFGPESGMEAPAVNEDEMHFGTSHGSRPGARVLT